MSALRSLLVVSALALLMIGCAIGPKGDAYLKISWVYSPQTIYFPELPSTIFSESYYLHESGTYYGEYTAWSGDFYTFYYTITEEPGSFGFKGADSHFEIALYSFGPSFYEWGSTPLSTAAQSIDNDAARSDLTGYLEAGSGAIERSQDGHSLRLEYRHLVPAAGR